MKNVLPGRKGARNPGWVDGPEGELGHSAQLRFLVSLWRSGPKS